MIKFTKMHGIGNDYVFINGFRENIENPSELAKRMSKRNFGIGSDGLILVLPSDKADFMMRIFNPDGSEAEMCGNGIRCFAKYVHDNKLTDRKTFDVETLAGIIKPEIISSEGKATSVKVDMGEPVLEKEKIPIESNNDSINDEIELANGKIKITPVSMGNPHAVIFVDELSEEMVKNRGPLVETHPAFPKRANVEFVKVLNENEIEMRVWERGAGETLSCGTGACASVVASVLNNKTGRKVNVHLLGGSLDIEWVGNNRIYMTGPSEKVFEGVWERD